MLSTLFSYAIQNTALYQLLGRKLTLSQPKPGQEFTITLYPSSPRELSRVCQFDSEWLTVLYATLTATIHFANPTAFYPCLSPAFRCQCGSNMMVIPSLVPYSLVKSPGLISVLLTPKFVCKGKLDTFSSFYPLSLFQKGSSYWDASNHAKYFLIFYDF